MKKTQYFSSFDGYISVERVSGWLRVEGESTEGFTVILKEGGKEISRTKTDYEIADGTRGRFYFTVPDEIMDGKTHLLEIWCEELECKIINFYLNSIFDITCYRGLGYYTEIEYNSKVSQALSFHREICIPQYAWLRPMIENEYYKRIIENSPFFDEAFYLSHNKDLVKSGISAIKHYLDTGYKEGREPIPITNPILRKLFARNRTRNPILFLEERKDKYPYLYNYFNTMRKIDQKNYDLLKASKIFNPSYYLKHNTDLAVDKVDPSLHFFQKGQFESRRFSTEQIHELAKLDTSFVGTPMFRWERCQKHIKIIDKHKNALQVANKAAFKSYLDENIAYKLIDNPRIAIVSFDVFDTLICRPVLEPENIFKFIEMIDYEARKISFASKRKDILAKYNDSLASIDDIYEYMHKEYKLSNRSLERLKQLEIEIELEFARRRETLFRIYKYAKSKNKRVICISDMYLSKQIIKQMLVNNGYDKIDEIYVSHEEHYTKASGLFAHVASQEGIEPSRVLHIGDNIACDYYFSIEAGLHAFWYPNSRDKILMNSVLSKSFISTDDIFVRLLMGFIYNQLEDNFDPHIHADRLFSDFNEMFQWCIFPMALSIALYIINNPQVQYGYDEISFAARDGFLPLMIYKKLCRYKEAIPGCYLYAGRRAYYCLKYEHFLDYLDACAKYQKLGGQKNRLTNIMRLAISDAKLLNEILLNHPEIDDNTMYHGIDQIINLFANDELDNLELDFQTKKQYAEKYYKKQLGSSGRRSVVFDLGFGGSISDSIMAAIKKPLDKVYLFSIHPNEELDRINNTHTYNVIPASDVPPHYAHMVYEELFAKPEGGCIGFKNGHPVLESIDIPEGMQLKYDFMLSKTFELTDKFVDLFGKYIDKFNITSFRALYQPLVDLVFKYAKEAKEYFADISFSDLVANLDAQNLSEKLSIKIPYTTPFSGTSFSEISSFVSDNIYPTSTDLRIGLHIHIYNIMLIQETISYLKKFPYKSDLFITTTANDNVVDYLGPLIQASLPLIKNMKISQVENRGRDVGPWIINTRDVQFNYDIFCHLHTKASIHFEWGTEWRRYLFENLLGSPSIHQIINLFNKREDIGLVFPTQFPKLRELTIQNNIDQFGNPYEKHLMESLLKRMSLRPMCLRSDLVFSAGNMYWYRPAAIRQLFTIPMRIEEFAQEPIGLGETLAHAIERLPAYICRANGYQIFQFEGKNP